MSSITLDVQTAPSTPDAGKAKGYVDSTLKRWATKDDAGIVIHYDIRLTNSEVAPTTADVTGAVNTRYFVNASGLTADRNFKFPSGSAGDIIEIRMIGEHASYALILKGDTGINLEGLTATEWDRLWHAGMILRFVYRASDGWRLVHDNRNGLIRRITLTGTATSFAFSNIPQYYSSLKLTSSLRCDAGGAGAIHAGLRINGDTGANYNWVLCAWTHNVTFITAEGLSATYGLIFPAPVAAAPTSYFSSCEAIIPNYTNTTIYKSYTAPTTAPTKNSGSSNTYIYYYGGIWKNAAAVTSITLLETSGANYIAGSVVSLYGVR